MHDQNQQQQGKKRKKLKLRGGYGVGWEFQVARDLLAGNVYLIFTVACLLLGYLFLTLFF
jgi:hypothetical protein